MSDNQQRMNWKEICEQYPDEWVGLVEYEEDYPHFLEGVVIAHHPDRKLFHKKIKDILLQYKDIALRYTGELVKNPEIPLSWQITGTA